MIYAVVLGLFLLGLLYSMVRASSPPQPVAFVQASSSPLFPLLRGDSWYWIERLPDRKMRLVRAKRDAMGQPQALATADALPAYDAADGQVAWIAQEGRRWMVYVSSADGENRRVLWSGPNEAHSVRLVGGRVYWTASGPAAAPNSGPFPPLAPTLQIVSVPSDGGTPALVTTLLDTGRGRLLGFADGALYLAVYRPITPYSTALYRVPLDGALPRRVAGESGESQALLTRDGALYWLALSRESVNMYGIACIRRLDRGGRPETLSDWLSAGGALFETDRGVFYVDGTHNPGLWPAGASGDLPRPRPLPDGFSAVAASGAEVLLRRTDAPRNNIMLYRIPMP